MQDIIRKKQKFIEEKGLVSKIKIAVSNSQLRSQMAEIIQAQLKEIGLEVSIENLEWERLLICDCQWRSGHVYSWLDLPLMTEIMDYSLVIHSSQKVVQEIVLNMQIQKWINYWKKDEKKWMWKRERDLYKQAADLINEEAVVFTIVLSFDQCGV